MNLKPKTINYLNSSAKKAELLLAQAVEYRNKFDSAKTSVSKLFYAKKLKKTVTSLEKYMHLFQDIEKLTTTAPETVDTTTEEKVTE